MVEWLAGGRIRGTSTERTTTTGFNPVAAVAGGWVELARTTLGSANSNIDVTGFTDKRYYMVLTNTLARSADSTEEDTVLGNASFDTGSNYSTRLSQNGVADITFTSQGSFNSNIGSNSQCFHTAYFSNLSSKEKLMISHKAEQKTAGAGTAPSRFEYTGKWSNTSNVMDRIRQYTGSGDTFNTGSEIVVLGWDPTDTHTTNFWEELLSVDPNVAGTSYTTSSFTAKKYLWIQIQKDFYGTSTSKFKLRFNGDTGSNYADRYSINGGAEVTNLSGTLANISETADDSELFTNIFIINNSANEKLGTSHTVRSSTAGAGTAPNRDEGVFKWTNTASQITQLTILAGNASWIGQLRIRVWGSD